MMAVHAYRRAETSSPISETGRKPRFHFPFLAMLGLCHEDSQNSVKVRSF